MSWNNIIIWLVAIYSVVPDYFRIAGINSPIFFEFLIIGLWAMTNRKLPINVQLWSFVAIATFPVCVSLLLHNNFSNIISTVLEKIVLVIVIFSTTRNRKSFYKMIDAILTVELFECITAVVHFIFDFNIFRYCLIQQILRCWVLIHSTVTECRELKDHLDTQLRSLYI